MSTKAHREIRHAVTLACGHKRIIVNAPRKMLHCLVCDTSREVVKDRAYAVARR